MGPPAADRAPCVPEPPPERVLHPRRRAPVPRPPRRAASWAGSAPRSTTRSTSTTATRGGCSASSSSRTTPRCSAALLDAAAAWLRRARARPHGRPDGLHDERRVRRPDRGLRPRAVRQAAVAPAVLRPPHARRLGMAKAMDLLMWELEISDREKMRPILFDLAADVEPKHGVRLRRMSFWRLRAEMDRFAEVYNSAWARQLGLRAVLEGGPRLLHRRAAARLRQAVVHGRRARRRDRRDGDHGPRHQPGPAEDERADPAVRLVALPAPQEDHRPRAGRLPRRQARVPAHRRRRRRCTSRTSTSPPARRSSGARWAGSSRRTAP